MLAAMGVVAVAALAGLMVWKQIPGVPYLIAGALIASAIL
jgi:hypothetical protein